MRIFGLDLTRARSDEPSKRHYSGVANPEGWLADIFRLHGNNHSGVAVNEVSGLTLPAVYACIRVLSETVAQLPLSVYRRTENGKEKAESHPVNVLISRRPNEDMTSFVWRDTIQGHSASWGNGYCYIQRNPAGRPTDLIPMLPDRTHPYRIDRELIYLSSSDPWARNTPLPEGQTAFRADAEDVLHIPAFGFDGILGYSPIRLHAEAIGLGLAAQQFGASFFGSGATMDGVLEHPSTLSEDAAKQLQAMWQKAYHGIDNAKKTAVLWEGMKYSRIGIPPEEAQFIETRQLQTREVASIYKVPPHMIGDLADATYSNISEQSIEFLRYTMAPWLRKWEEELERKLLSDTELRAGYIIRFDRTQLMRGTPKELAEQLRLEVYGGWTSRNEAREEMGRNPAVGLDEFLEPRNMAPAGTQSEQDEPQDGRDYSHLMPLITRFAEQVANAEQKATEKAIASIIVRNLQPLAMSLEAVGGPNAESLIEAFADRYTKGNDHAAVILELLEGGNDGA